MQMNLEGRVGKISLPPHPPRNCLQPLFEAVVNAIHAVKEAENRRGRITIHVERDKSQGVLRTKDGEKTELEPVQSFTITDNGVGFNEENMQSFQMADSLYKKRLGGKGIGRLMWLKAFDRVEVNSIFKADDETKRRTFRFTIPDEGVAADRVERVDQGDRSTTVRLINMLAPYRDKCPKGTPAIAGHIVQHCVEYLVQDDSPNLTLSDPDGDGEMNLNEYFRKLKVKASEAQFDVRGQQFRLRHILLCRREGLRHQIHFCANQATVMSENLSTHLPDLTVPVQEPDSGKHVVYHGYLSGDFLDDTVTQEGIDFHKVASEEMSYDGAIPWPDVVRGAVDQAEAYLHPLVLDMREQKTRRIREYVQKEAPQYRSLLKHRPDMVDRIPPEASGNALDLELYKFDQQYDRELREQGEQLFAQASLTARTVDDIRAELGQFIEQWNDKNKDKLAQYVAYRKAILSYLQNRLKRQPDGNFPLEEDVHQVIMPLRVTSDDVRQDQLNLWIIDERLSFHYYLASDKPLRTATPLSINDGKEPDLVAFSHIFDRAFAFANSETPFGSIVVVEFKRPMRDDYSDTADPIQKVQNYIEAIKGGRAKTRGGRLFDVRQHTPFYAYIICDLTPKMQTLAYHHDFKPTPDEAGFFAYHTNLGAYIEIISFEKLIRDARQRNAIFFEKLGLPSQLVEPTLSPDADASDPVNVSEDG